jgi:hypothetical protein
LEGLGSGEAASVPSFVWQAVDALNEEPVLRPKIVHFQYGKA